QYRACVRAGGCAAEPDDHGWGRGNRPVIKVAWADALRYAEWLSRASGHRYRLPSEAEWEYAARAGGLARYPWGDDSGMARANCRGCGAKPWSGDRSAPAASFAANGFGFFDLHGNVSEWVADCWASTHRDPAGGRVRDQAPRVAGAGVDCAKRVTKGGDWYYIPALATSAARMGNDAGMTSYTIGFRVARDVTSESGVDHRKAD
ncbi:MAG: SUMF1/EgtB/PvdO family nonheme iron enzyme, partial [Rhodospirillaceae bacterium]|nr:SUMF1/EgtB/PvdO family nonheme iron enzyme [Rhodospirillaceae bacterium]